MTKNKMRRVKEDFVSLFRPQSLAPIDGMRAMTCLMITALHIGQVLNLLIPPHPHPQWTRYLQSYTFRLMSLFVLSLETFFMLSGFLLTQKLIQQRFQVRLREYPVYVLKRACRLWPGILLATAMMLILGEPKSNWLSVWLFYQNYVSMDHWSVGSGTLWSVSLDMHMHIVLPLILVVIARYRGTSYLLVFLSVVRSLLVFDPPTMDIARLPFYHNSLALVMPPRTHDWVKTMYNVTLPFEKLRTVPPLLAFMERLYYPTTVRYSSFVIGAMLAFSLRDAKQTTASPFGKFKKHAYLTAIGFYMVILTSPADPDNINSTVVAITISVTRQLFSISQAFILFCTLCPPTHPYYSPWLRSFLSLRIWTPLARLSYLIYVIHFRILFELILTYHQFFDSARSSIDRLLLICLVIVIAICFVLSAVWFVLVEKPFERWTNKFLSDGRKEHEK